MIAAHEESRKGLVRLAVLFLALGSTACSPSLVERAIEARGGALASYRKEVEATVFTGLAGDWSWEVAYRVPESFRWSLHTLGEEQRLLFDGTTARHQLGSMSLPGAQGDDAVRSQARWFAVTSLDVLRGPGVSWVELPPGGLPAGIARGLTAHFADDPAPFDLYFDERDLLTRARARVALQPIGIGLLEASFDDYRTVDGFRLPFSGEYRLDGRLLLRERAVGWWPNDPTLVPELFSGQ